MTSKTACMYGTSDRWAPSSWRDYTPMITTEYMGFPVANAQTLTGHFTLQSNLEQASSSDHGLQNKPASKRSLTSLDTRPAPLEASTTTMYSLPAMSTASNAQVNVYDSATISPMDTHFDVNHASPSSDSKFSFDDQMYQTAPANFTTFTNSTDPHPSKRRWDSLQSGVESHSPTMRQVQVGRRRGSEYAEPGSARALYLEKNRKAASKCRSKQKKQQEELVETARDVERQNRILKAEVEMLKSGMRHLMELVGQHTECPDARLKLYVQREADRLASGGQRNALPSPLSGSSYSGTGSIDKVSSPEEE